MPKKTFTPEQIVGKLRQIEVLVSQGKTAKITSGGCGRSACGRARGGSGSI